jgi:hypothetical protein
MATNETEYLFVVDTQQYAGNFERPMCAFITGVVGECGVGEEEADVARESFNDKVRDWFEEHVAIKMDDNGIDRPVAIRPTPGWFNNGRGGHFRRNDSQAVEKAQAHWDESCEQDAKNMFTCYAHLPEYAETEARRKLAEKGKKFWNCAAYQSVEIYLDDMPPDNIFRLMHQRAFAFTEYAAKHGYPWQDGIVVDDAYVIKRTTRVTEEEIYLE